MKKIAIITLVILLIIVFFMGIITINEIKKQDIKQNSKILIKESYSSYSIKSNINNKDYTLPEGRIGGSQNYCNC